jgi:hypothetical protein
MAPIKRKRLALTSKEKHKPNSQAFLQSISPAQAKVSLEEITESDVYPELINHRHITSTLTVDQLKSATSIEPFDGENYFIYFKTFNFVVVLGAYFATWMECKIKEEHLLIPPRNYPHLNIHRNSSQWSSIQEEISTFYSSNSIESVDALIHHTILRSTMQSLP